MAHYCNWESKKILTLQACLQGCLLTVAIKKGLVLERDMGFS